MRIVVKVEKIREIQKERRDINRRELCDIDFYEDGKLLEIDPEIIKHFMFTGLNNTDFIDSDFYKTEFKNKPSG
ncbi:hypothetical protein LCGC14_2039500 [marine sediment metagenome]|uniref:Uncharacterized protein n=1 Tax=marine sediment metagenome TaxID=412755 RepID=A0A0F9H5R1_9ZZZZ|nr:hypothetical protein [Candidatus Scalindua sp.]